ncbi:MAG TPA: alpha/beta fold hydrolase [Nannocystaceae bacterium]|nr:alpha/beta fold hydrolase [Nannocystaceae bacterium]
MQDPDIERHPRTRGWLLAALLTTACGDDGGAGEGSAESTDASTSAGSAASEATSADASTGASTGSSAAESTSADASTSDGETSADGDSTGGGAATPIVLVHGAWMGGWAWDEVVPLLEDAGHPTIVVELPAHGDDATAAADATLASYRDAVLDALDGLEAPAAVVGHSMGGMVISEVAEARPAAIATLVYVAAFLPRDGQALFDIASTDPDSITAMHLVDHGDGTASIDPAFIGDVFCGDCSEAAVQTIVDRTRPEPLAPLLTPASLTEAAFGTVARTYVHTELDAAVSLAAQEAMVAATPVDEVRSLATAHSPFLSQPQMLADTLVELVETR